MHCVEKPGIYYTYITAPEPSYLSIRISINLAQSHTIYSQYDSVLVKSLLATHITPFALSLSLTHKYKPYLSYSLPLFLYHTLSCYLTFFLIISFSLSHLKIRILKIARKKMTSKKRNLIVSMTPKLMP